MRRHLITCEHKFRKDKSKILSTAFHNFSVPEEWLYFSNTDSNDGSVYLFIYLFTV